MRKPHTPGPWCVVPFDRSKPDGLVAIESQNTFVTSAFAAEKADVKLMTAAPDMLNALKVVMLDPKIVAWFKANDPKAFDQIVNAVEAAE